MLLHAVVVVVTVFGQICAEDYQIPVPKIEAFSPQGFRISIKDAPGVTRVDFHVNINKKMSLGDHGELFKSVRRARKGQWVFNERKVVLEIGDVINYWILVIHEQTGYRKDGAPFEVTGKVSYKKHRKPNKHNSKTTTTTTICKIGNPTPKPTIPPSNETQLLLSRCKEVVMNITNSRMSLMHQIETLQKENLQLIEALEKYPDVKQLTIFGRIPQEDDAFETVKFLLREKLDLEPNIRWAKKKSSDSISFELTSVGEKMRVLNQAKEKLKYSKIFIV